MTRGTYEAEDPKANHQLPEKYDEYLSKCEYDALSFGSAVADRINRYSYEVNTPRRVLQEHIVENLGFAPWLWSVPKYPNTTDTSKDILSIQRSKGWIFGEPNSNYDWLRDQWIYFFGDSTIRQVWSSFSSPIVGKEFEQRAKQYSRQFCQPQDHRKHHPPNGFFPEEGWQGSCGLNEVSCHLQGFGRNGKITYDWKHFPFEDYDSWFFGDNGPWKKGFMETPAVNTGEGEGNLHAHHRRLQHHHLQQSIRNTPYQPRHPEVRKSNRRPSLLVVQFGLHTCSHTHEKFLKNGPNEAVVERHRKDIDTLFKSIRNAIDNPIASEVNEDHPQTNSTASSASSQPLKTTFVIIMTSGNMNLGETWGDADACVTTFNRLAAEAAWAYGFAVLDRGEIERRLMAKSLYSKNPVLPEDMHLVQPAQNLVATSLLQLYNCIAHYNISHGAMWNEKGVSSRWEAREVPRAYRDWHLKHIN
jgi:hypothetical protein